VHEGDRRERKDHDAIVKCPACGGEMVAKEVEKQLRGFVNTAILRVPAEVCLHCGERLYSKDVARSFERIKGKAS
jgi:YgiT-type zinc finger domain-containing protein